MFAWEGATLFVETALSINQHLPGYVDAYFGPRDLREAVERKGKVPLRELEQMASDLADSLAHEDYTVNPRAEYLNAHVRAMQTSLRILQGESIGIVDEVQGLYGVTPHWVEEDIFEEAHRILGELLPGSQPLAERMRQFHEHMEVSGDVAAPAIRHLAEDLRARARSRFPLPTNESCEFAFVRDKPWRAYNWYLGQSMSRIDFNLDLPMSAFWLPYLIAHEGYPGHHTELAIKEQKLYREGGLAEHSVLLSNAPSQVVSEGMAVCALDVIASPHELVDVYRQFLEEVGLSGAEAQRVQDLRTASLLLVGVGDNQVLLLHEKGASDEEVVAYGSRYSLSSEKEEQTFLRSCKDPLWRSHRFTYTIGYNLIARLLNKSDNKDEWFGRLLQEPIAPAQLLRWIA